MWLIFINLHTKAKDLHITDSFASGSLNKGTVKTSLIPTMSLWMNSFYVVRKYKAKSIRTKAKDMAKLIDWLKLLAVACELSIMLKKTKGDMILGLNLL